MTTVTALKRLRNIAIIFFIFAFTGCDNKDKEPLRLAHISWPGYEALTLAKTRNLYKNIDVVLYRPANNTETFQAFQNGVVDMVALTLAHTIEYQERIDEPLTIVAVLDISNGADVIIANEDIKSIKDLKGKRLGMEPTAFGAFFVTRAIETVTDFTLNQVHILPITIDEHKEMYLSGKVDAIASYEPQTSEILKNKGHIIFDSSQIPNEIIDVLVTKESFASRRPQAITELIKGYLKAINLIKTHPDKAIEEMAAFEGITSVQFEKSLAGIHIPDHNENRQLLSSTDSSLKAALDKMTLFLKSKNIIKKDNNLSPAVSDFFLPPDDKKQ